MKVENPKSFLAAAVVIGLFLPSAAAQDNYPSKPISVVIPSAAGGSGELSARIMTTELSQILGQSLVIVPAPGAGGRIAAGQLKRAAPDGYTIGSLHSPPLVISPALAVEPLDYDPLEDFIPLAGATVVPYGLAVPSSMPVNTVEEFIAYVKERPGELNYVSTGPGSLPQMAMELFMSLTGTDLVEVPFGDATAAAVDLASNRVQAYFVVPPIAAPHMQSGAIKILGVSSLEEGTGFYAGIPSIDQAGVKGYEIVAWGGYFAPKGTPEPILAKLRDAFGEAKKRPQVAEQMRKAGLTDWPASAEEVRERIASEFTTMKKLATERNIKID